MDELLVTVNEHTRSLTLIPSVLVVLWIIMCFPRKNVKTIQQFEDVFEENEDIDENDIEDDIQAEEAVAELVYIMILSGTAALVDIRHLLTTKSVQEMLDMKVLYEELMQRLNHKTSSRRITAEKLRQQMRECKSLVHYTIAKVPKSILYRKVAAYLTDRQ